MNILGWIILVGVTVLCIVQYLYYTKLEEVLKRVINAVVREDGFPCGSDGKASAYNAGDPGSVHGSGRSPGEGNDKPLQNACLENPMDRGVGGLQSMSSQRVGHD